MKFLEWAFICIYKAWHFSLRDVFIYQKKRHLKKQDNLRYVFIYNNPDTLRYAIFHEIVLIVKGGGHFYMKKTMQSALNFYILKIVHFALRVYLQESRHFASHFYIQKIIRFASRFIYKIYRIV